MRKRLFVFLTKKPGAGTGGTKTRLPWAFLSRLAFRHTERMKHAEEVREWSVEAGEEKFIRAVWAETIYRERPIGEFVTIMGTVINNNKNKPTTTRRQHAFS